MKRKSDILLTESEKKEALAFMRPFAHSVVIAKTFLNEGESTETQQQQQQQTETEVDPFAGVDLENLPADAKAAIEKAKLGFANLQKEATTKAAEAAAATELARKHQSRADKFGTVLKQHNLDPEGKSSTTQASPEEQEIQELAAEFVKDLGVEQAVAIAYAKMHVKAMGRSEKRVLAQVGAAVGPHIQTVGSMSVDRILEQAANSEEFNGALVHDLVYDKAREILATIVSNGGAVDENTTRTAIQMAYGEVSMSGKLNQQQQQPQPVTRQPTINRNGGFMFPPMKQPGNGNNGRNGSAPVAANDDTAKAVQRVADAMKRGLPVKKA